MNIQTATTPAAASSSVRQLTSRSLELAGFVVLISLCSGLAVSDAALQSLIFRPGAVRAGEWWRLFTHSFVHVSWYHLLLDASAFLLLYRGLLEGGTCRRLAYVVAAATGGLVLSCLAAPSIATQGLCGLSGVAHGLMAISAAELMRAHPYRSSEWRAGAVTFLVVVLKAAFEAVTGGVLFGFLYFGLVGEPVAVSHAGGVVGGLVAVLFSASQATRR